MYPPCLFFIGTFKISCLNRKCPNICPDHTETMTSSLWQCDNLSVTVKVTTKSVTTKSPVYSMTWLTKSYQLKLLKGENLLSYFDNIFVLINMGGGLGPGHQRQRHWPILLMLIWYWKCVAFWFLSCLFVCGLNSKCCTLNLDLMISLCYTYDRNILWLLTRWYRWLSAKLQ